MTDAHSAHSEHAMRRLKHATTFEGNLKCTFDPSMPLNMTDLTQPFIMFCETPSDGGLSDGVWVLIILGSLLGLCFIMVACVHLSTWFNAWRERRKERRNAKLLREYEEAQEAAGNDFCLSEDSETTKSSTATTASS